MKPRFKDGMAISTTFASIVQNAWMLAMGYSTCHYVVAASLARTNADAVVAFARALAASDSPAEIQDIRAGRSDATTLEDRLASAKRSIEGKTYVDAQVGMMMPFRKELFLVSGVIC